MQFSCLGESIEKYITFTVPIEREVRRNEKVEIKLQKNYLTYNSLWIPQDLLQVHYQVFVNNLYDGIYRTKCKFGHDHKKCEICGINNKYCSCFF